MPAYNDFSACLGLLRNRSYVVVTLSVFLVFIFFYHSPSSSRVLHSETPSQRHFGGFDGKWDYKRDADNLLLTDQQCNVAFPGLFEEIARPLALRQNRRITLEEVDKIEPKNGYIRCLLFDHKLYIIATEGAIYSRGLATLHALQRAIQTSPEPLPNIEFTFNVDDRISSEAQWAYARQPDDKDIWLMPDFGFWSWPETKIGSYGEVQMKAISADKATQWNKKVDKLLWRGATMGLEVRERFINVTRNKEWADVKALDWHDKESMKKDLKSMDQHCEYKYLAHTEGNSYSGRLKYLQNCRSVVVAHKMDWIQHHHPLMKSSGRDQNYVEVDRDFGNLEAVLTKLRSKDAKTEKIADRMVKVFRERYLTPAAEACYWRRLIRGWAEVSFKPEFLKTVNGTTSWRGLPVESFMLERRLEWEPY